MRRVYPLARHVSFEDIARALAETELDLARVVSCTFPGRPEPRSAKWTLPLGRAVLAYEYIPDTELRALLVVSPDFSLFADRGPDGDSFEAFFTAQLGANPFTGFDELREELHAGEHIPANRAAAAFRMAATASDDSVDGEAELVGAITHGAGRGPVAAAAELFSVVTDRFHDAIEFAREESDDVELRHHLRRATDRLGPKL